MPCHSAKVRFSGSSKPMEVAPRLVQARQVFGTARQDGVHESKLDDRLPSACGETRRYREATPISGLSLVFGICVFTFPAIVFPNRFGVRLAVLLLCLISAVGGLAGGLVLGGPLVAARAHRRHLRLDFRPHGPGLGEETPAGRRGSPAPRDAGAFSGSESWR